MLEHLRVFAYIGLVRAAIGVPLGIVLIWKAKYLNLLAYGSTQVTQDVVDFDCTAFQVLGWLCIAFAVARAVQGILALRGKAAALPLGKGLAIFDIVNLVLFPISTAFGLYGTVIYKHPDTVDFLTSRSLTLTFPPHMAGGQPARGPRGNRS